MAKLRNLKIENEALAGVNAADAAEITITITSSVSAENNKFEKDTSINLTANVTADGSNNIEYVWCKGDEQVGTDKTLTVIVSEDTKGDYKCKVTATYDDTTKSKESDVFTIDIAESSSSGGSTESGGSSSGDSDEPMVGNRTLSEHLRMRLLGYI